MTQIKEKTLTIHNCSNGETYEISLGYQYKGSGRRDYPPDTYDLTIRNSAGMLDFVKGLSPFSMVECLRAKAGDLEAIQFMDWYSMVRHIN